MTATTTADHLELLRRAETLDGSGEREWAVEDCRHLEADLLAAGERIERLPPKEQTMGAVIDPSYRFPPFRRTGG